MSADCFDKAVPLPRLFSTAAETIRCKILERRGRLDLKSEDPLREVGLVRLMVGSCDPEFF